MTDEHLQRPNSVAIVVTTFNDSEFLGEALRSIVMQWHKPDEIVVVDDGSDESPEWVLREFPSVRFLRKSNGGLSSARNYGLQKVKSRFVSFLDADDRYEPNAIASGLACFTQHPEAAMVFGGHRRIREDGTPIGPEHVPVAGTDAYATFLETNIIGMHATVLYRREILLALGGFDETLDLCEDYDIYLRVARSFPLASHKEIVAEYRWHGRNMSADSAKMLAAVLKVHARHRKQDSGAYRRAWGMGQTNWRSVYGPPPGPQWAYKDCRGTLANFVHRLVRAGSRRLRNRRVGRRIHAVAARIRKQWPPVVGDIRFGDLQSTTPASVIYGYDRGTPIDRYYIEAFLQLCSSDVKGRVLEVAEDTYSQRFGGTRVTQQDVLHLNEADPKVTILGDLTQPGVLPENAFDCIILTQTLQMIFDLDRAIERLYAALKPGGVLLLTVPGITNIEADEWGAMWCWSFTAVSIRKLFERRFDPALLQIAAHGNVFAAVSFLFGAALEEVDTRKLDVVDGTYPVIVTLRAQKSLM